MTKLPQVAIIVLNWKQPDLTIKTIDSICSITHKHFNYHLFLVDNGSGDGSYEVFQKKYHSDSKFTLLQTGSNLGFVGGNNYAMEKIAKHSFDYVLLINNDVIVDPNFLDILVKTAETNPQYGALGPKIYFAPGYEFHHDRYQKNEIGHVIWSAGGHIDWNNIFGENIGIDEVDHGQHDQIRTDVDYLTGCCLLLKSEVIKKVGYLDTAFYLYMEDDDYCQRIKKNGWQLAYVPESKIWHVNSGSTKRDGSFLDYYLTRNRYIFGLRYATFKTKVALIRESIKFFFTTPYHTRRLAVIDFYTHKWGKGSLK